MCTIPTRFIRGFSAQVFKFALLAGSLSAQQQQQPPVFADGNLPAAQEQSGSSTAGIFAPVLDAEKRPITRGWIR